MDDIARIALNFQAPRSLACPYPVRKAEHHIRK